MVRVVMPVGWEVKVTLLSEGSLVRSPRHSVNMGGWFGGLPFETVVDDRWTAYWFRIDPRELNVIGWGLSPESDGAPEPRPSLRLLSERRLMPTRIHIRYEPSGGLATPTLPTPFASTLREVVRIDPGKDIMLLPGLPWTDEYAEAVS